MGKGTLYIGSEAGLFIYKNGNLEQKLIDPNVLSASNIITGLNLSEDGTPLDSYQRRALFPDTCRQENRPLIII